MRMELSSLVKEGFCGTDLHFFILMHSLFLRSILYQYKILDISLTKRALRALRPHVL